MPRFANIKGSMNPFDNNRPVLSSSDRLKNKRDKTIYQAEKQRFQNKRCGDKNVKYYNNGSIRNMKSYDLQNSLARGNALCEDCDDKGLLCGGVASKSALGSIQMGNNVVSEYWGGGFFNWKVSGGGLFYQTVAFPVIQADISGSWGGTTDKADLSGAILPSDSTVNMPWGYINNLIKIPRNLNGSGIVIDPCNNLFPDGHCGEFKHMKSHIPYMNHSQLKTYLVITTTVSLNPPPTPLVCGDPLLNDITGQQISAFPFLGSENVLWNGVIEYICCKKTDTFSVQPFGGSTTPGWGLFDIYVGLQYVKDYVALNKMVSMERPYNPTVTSATGDVLIFSLGGTGAIIWPWYVESFRIFQGTQKLNQTKHNTTKQSYMSCLENKTKKIKFT